MDWKFFRLSLLNVGTLCVSGLLLWFLSAVQTDVALLISLITLGAGLRFLKNDVKTPMFVIGLGLTMGVLMTVTLWWFVGIPTFLFSV